MIRLFLIVMSSFGSHYMATVPQCRYPSVQASTQGPVLVVEQGPWYTSRCPRAGAAHHVVVIRKGRDRVILREVPGP